MLNVTEEEIEIGVECPASDVSFSFDVGRSMFDVLFVE